MATSSDAAENRYIAEKLDEVADLLEQQHASNFRVNAYRAAADYVVESDVPLRNIHAASGLKGLEDLPTIGTSIARAVAELLETGTLAMLDRLRGSMDPEELFQTVPTIGPTLAKRLHNELHIETLEALETAALNGRLGGMKGIGLRRVRSIQHALADILARRRQAVPTTIPPVETLLEVDEEYRTKARDGQLATISPRRFNPSGNVRIPVLHAERGPWQFTVLYSNSLDAHRFGRTRDWVLIFFEKDDHTEGQCTVVTEHRGVLADRRVVRGHERECLSVYETAGDTV